MTKSGNIFSFLGVTASAFLFCSCALASPEVAVKELTFQDCLKTSGNRVLRTFPPQCVTPDGHVFVDKATATGPVGRLCVDSCGNGTCEEIVCMGETCPCAETSENCSSDCKK